MGQLQAQNSSYPRWSVLENHSISKVLKNTLILTSPRYMFLIDFSSKIQNQILFGVHLGISKL